MIIFRYLCRELLVTLAAVSAVLLLIIMSGRFIFYLALAAKGQLDPAMLFTIMGLRLPGFLQMILPLGLFLAILLAYGRMYLDSEMSVLAATGMSRNRLLAYTLAPAALVAVLVAVLCMLISPLGVNRVEQIINQQNAMSEFDTLVPGRFQGMKNSTRVTYTESLSEQTRELGGVFISEVLTSTSGKKERGISVLVADKGHQESHPDGSRYLILENGYRYDGKPGQADYREIQYDRYGVLLPSPEVISELTERDGQPTLELVGSKNPRQIAELQWRLSLPLAVLVVTVLAVPLARVNPRQGRFLKLLPAIMLYMVYLGLLIAMRGQIDKARISPALGMWWVHGLFLALGVLLMYWRNLRLKWAALRSDKEMARGHA